MAVVASRFPADMADYFRTRWDHEAIWRLKLPVELMAIAGLEWHLRYPFWSTRPPEPLYDLTPGEVLADPDCYPIHRDRMARADTWYPLDLGRFGGRPVILDGIHRLARLVGEGCSFQAVRFVPWEHLRMETATADQPRQEQMET